MALNTDGQLWWGLTDVILVIFAVALALILGGRKGDKTRTRDWQIVFFAFGIAALFGAAVHTFDISHDAQVVIWCVLYIILFEASRIFDARLVFYMTAGEHLSKKEGTWLRIFQIVLFVATIILHLLLPDYEDALYVFIGYAVILLIPLIYLMFKGQRKSLWVKLMMLSLLLSLLSQSLSFLSGAGVVLGHIFDMAAMLFGYLIAKEDMQ